MKFIRFLKILIVCYAIFVFSSVTAGTSELEKHSGLGYIYWYGGEDVSYDDGGSNLVSVEDYDTVDMFIDMELSDMQSNMGAPEKYTDIAKDIPAPVIKNKTNKISSDNKPIIAIIIDDMGVNRAMSKAVLDNIKKPVTLSFLPYGSDLQEQVDRAKKDKHEVILHLPWEPYSIGANPGPNALMTDDTSEEILSKLAVNLNSFKGYDGINNHMGSKFSRYPTGIELVMEELKKRNLFFLDSLTDSNSIAETIAHKYSVPTTHRNIFLDHVDSEEFVEHALNEVERIALETGSAVAIGHPKQATINGLKKWLPSLAKKGFKLVTLKEVINERQKFYNVNASKNDIIHN